MAEGNCDQFRLECPVRSLHAVLTWLGGQSVMIEHIYDY